MGLGHANIAARPRLSRIAGTIFVTPAFHAFHHSASQPETDSNYGEVLTIWDHLLGTTSKREGQVSRFGLGDAYDSDATSLKGQLRLPIDPR
jgi:sterol desaturase/sphingolipid hydroxylase (fatty acid hydroxylase superfamily)